MGRPPKYPADGNLEISENDAVFTDQELAALKQEAEDEYLAEQKAEQARAFKDDTKLKLKKKALFAEGKDAKGEDVVKITIDLAPHAPHIALDGRYYYHGVEYRFSKAQAATIMDIMNRTWQHQSEIEGTDTNVLNSRKHYRKQLSAA